MFSFSIDLEYESLPPFRTHGKRIGHHLENCKYADQENNIHEKNVTQAKKNCVPKINNTFPVEDPSNVLNKVIYPQVIAKGKFLLQTDEELVISHIPPLIPSITGDGLSLPENPFRDCSPTNPTTIFCHL